MNRVQYALGSYFCTKNKNKWAAKLRPMQN